MRINATYIANNRGYLLLTSVAMALISGMLIIILGQSSVESLKTTSRQVDKAQLLSIAESGINHYIWLQTRFPDDINQGLGASDYTDSAGKKIGAYELTLIDGTDSNLIKIKSTATMPKISPAKAIVATIAKNYSPEGEFISYSIVSWREQ